MSSMTGSTGYGGGQATGGFNSNMRGVDPRMKHISGHHRFQQFTPEQMDLLQQMMGQLGPDSFLGKLAGGDEEMFNEMEAPALRQFSGLQGNIASRFSGMGMGAGKSSGHMNTQNAAASDFAQQLQGNRMNLQNQALKDMMSYSQMLLGQEPYALKERQQKESSGWGGLAGTLAGGAGGFFLGGPSGALKGAKLGYDVGSQF